MSNRWFWGAVAGLTLLLAALVLSAAVSPSGRAAYLVPRVTCVSCSDAISQGLRDVAGVAEVQVDVPNRTVRVAYDPKTTDPGEIALALGRIGYPGKLVGFGASASPAAVAAASGGCSCCNKPSPLER